MSTTSLMTFAEFEQLPDIEGYKRELVNGEVITMPPPELEHSKVAKRILMILLRHLDEARVWPDHTGYRMGGSWVEPDLSVSWPDQRRDEKYFVGSPMVAVELLSPSEQIEEKLDLYFAEGAKEVWVVSYRRKAMAAYVAEGGKVFRNQVQDEFRSDAAGLTIRLAEIFG